MIFTKEFSVKKIRLYGIFLAALICIFGGCLVLGIRVQHVTCDHVFILSFSQESQSFGDSDISNAQKEGVNLTYVKRLYQEISNGFRTEETEVVATNDNYAYFVNLELRRGTFFNKKQEEHELAVAVLNEAAAYQLFGNYDCIGEIVYLDQNGFEVIGIVKENGNEEVPRIYISDRVAERLDMPCSKVNQLWCQFHNVAEAALIIEKMGYGMEEMDIVQMDLYKVIFMQRFFILLILVGITLFFYVIKKLITKVKNLRLKDVLDTKGVIKCALQVLICIVCLVVLFKIIKLSLCIPPNYALLGKSWLSILVKVFEFYTLLNLQIDNMQFLNLWNYSSLLFVVLGIWVMSELMRRYILRVNS